MSASTREGSETMRGKDHDMRKQISTAVLAAALSAAMGGCHSCGEIEESARGSGSMSGSGSASGTGTMSSSNSTGSRATGSGTSTGSGTTGADRLGLALGWQRLAIALTR